MHEVLLDPALALIEWSRGMGWAGFGLVFVVVTLAMVPASPLTAVAGYLFGPLWGMLLISPLGVLTAFLAFLIGRTLARPWVLRRLERYPRVAAVEQGVSAQGFRVVLLLRLASVIPFAPLSYVLGASRVSARDFLLGSWLGLLPGTFLYLYLGSLAADLGQLVSGASTGQGAFGGAIRWLAPLALASVLLLIVRTARRALSTAINEEMNHEQAV
ncbi:TVP38/TMEM64 family inner membrane protein YdjZ [compost metagenome]